MDFQSLFELDAPQAVEFLRDLDIKLAMALKVCENHEQLKMDFQPQRRSLGKSAKLSLGLRLMNFTMQKTALIFHGYDKDHLRSQGTTPTLVVYGKLSTFDSFLQMLIQVALIPELQSQIREN